MSPLPLHFLSFFSLSWPFSLFIRNEKGPLFHLPSQSDMRIWKLRARSVSSSTPIKLVLTP